eukprot:2657922-Amphidinium_carterae.1
MLTHARVNVVATALPDVGSATAMTVVTILPVGSPLTYFVLDGNSFTGVLPYSGIGAMMLVAHF